MLFVQPAESGVAIEMAEIPIAILALRTAPRAKHPGRLFIADVRAAVEAEPIAALPAQSPETHADDFAVRLDHGTPRTFIWSEFEDLVSASAAAPTKARASLRPEAIAPIFASRPLGDPIRDTISLGEQPALTDGYRTPKSDAGRGTP